jgi:alpha-tubulin suppressor-like RCC1 family protein
MAAQEIAGGMKHSVVLDDDGTVRAWGDGRLGQLGNGEFVASDAPVAVAGPVGQGRLTGVVAIAAGMYHTLALREDGSVWAWGCDTFGQLGNGQSGPDAHGAVPVQVIGLDGQGPLQTVVAIAAGWDHSIALLEDGTVVAWGSRCHGQLGDGVRDSNRWSTRPVHVLDPTTQGALTGVAAIAAGAHHNAALREDGTLLTWGSNHEGQLGRGVLGEVGRMRQISLALPWTPEAPGSWSLALSYRYTDPSHTDVADRVELADAFDGPPIVVADEAATREMQAGSFSRNADFVEMRATVRYPARARVGQLITIDLAEVQIGSPGTDNDYAQQMQIVLTNRDTGQEVRLNAVEALDRANLLPRAVVGPEEDGSLDGVTSVACGVYHTVALREDGGVWTWGYNGTGQLGHGTRESTAGSDYLYIPTPTQMIGGRQGGDFLTGITAVAAGYEATYAIDGSGGGWACGWNVYGGLGMGVSPNRANSRARMQSVSVPVGDETVPVEGIAAISAGAYHALALSAEGELLGWGHNGFGQLGDSTRQDREAPIAAGSPAADREELAAREPVVGPRPPSPAVEAQFPEPSGAGVIDVRDHGAVGDGAHLDQAALQAAIDAAHEVGGGVVLVPEGVYRTGTLDLKSGVRLHLTAGATILGSTNRAHYSPGALISAQDAENIAITGAGTLDAHGEFCGSRGWRHNIIRMQNCNNVTIEGIATTNSGSWTQHYIRVIGLTLRNIRLNSVRPGRNNDGLDFTGCEEVLIEGCVVASDDDCIVIKSTRAAEVNRNIRALNNIVYAYASGYKLGTETRSVFDNMVCDGLQAFGGTTLGLYTVDGSETRGVHVSNVRGEAARCALGLRLGARLRPNYFAEGEALVPGVLEDVTVRDVEVTLNAVPWREVLLAHGVENAEWAHQLTVRPVEPSFISGLPDKPIRGVLVEDFSLSHPGGGTEDEALIEVPERLDAYPSARMFGALPAWGLFLRHAEDVVLRNIALEVRSADGRPPLVNLNIPDEEIEIEGLSVHEAWR